MPLRDKIWNQEQRTKKWLAFGMKTEVEKGQMPDLPNHCMAVRCSWNCGKAICTEAYPPSRQEEDGAYCACRQCLVVLEVDELELEKNGEGAVTSYSIRRSSLFVGFLARSQTPQSVRSQCLPSPSFASPRLETTAFPLKYYHLRFGSDGMSSTYRQRDPARAIKHSQALATTASSDLTNCGRRPLIYLSPQATPPSIS